MSELKPCPFCGRIPTVDDCGDNRFFVRCKCGITQDKLYGQRCDAVKRWNTRRQQPEQKKGKWIIKAINTFELAYGSTGYEPVYECSECGGIEESYLRLDEPIMPEDADFPKYCPNCGAKMEKANGSNT